MTRPHREALAVVLPTLACIGVEWALWGRRNELVGRGVEVDAGALGVAFLVALAFGGATPERYRHSADSLLLRLANACQCSVGAAVCAFVCGLMRLRMLNLVSLEVGPAELVIIRSAAIGVTAVGAAYAAVVGFAKVLPRHAFALAAAAVPLAMLSVRYMSNSGTVRFEQLLEGPPLVVELDALASESETVELSVAGVDWAYEAVGKNCIFQRAGAEGRTTRAASVKPTWGEAGFAVCPALSLRQAGDLVLAVTAHTGAVEFQLRDGQVESPSPDAADRTATLARDAPEIAAVAAQRAPVPQLVTLKTVAGLRVERRVSDARCTTRVSVDGRTLTTFEGVSYAFDRELCAALRVGRWQGLGIVSIRVGDSSKKADFWLHDEHESNISLHDIESAVTPPRWWAMVAWSGVGTSALLVALAAVWLVRTRALHGFVAAEHAGGGTIILADESRFTARAATSLAPGPVMVRGKLPAGSHAGYRQRADVAETALEIRSAAAHASDIQRRSTRVWAASVAALTLTFSSSLLLIAAWLLGLGH